jgi:hypothetical protein
LFHISTLDKSRLTRFRCASHSSSWPTLAPLTAKDKVEADALKYLIHHTVLPLKLPQKDDWSASNERALLNHTVRAFRDFRNTLAVEHAEAAQQIAAVVDTIGKCFYL